MNEDITSLIDDLEYREQRWRRRAVWYTLVPLFLIASFVYYGLIRVQDARTEFETYTHSADSLRAVVAQYNQYYALRDRLVQELLTDVQFELSRTDFNKGRLLGALQHYRIEDSSLGRQLKAETKVLANRVRLDLRDTSTLQLSRPQGKRLLLLLATLRDAGWTSGGDTPTTGFDADGLVKYALAQTQGRASSPSNDSTALQDGDIVNTEAGYRFFYFKIDNTPIYIGMTEVGVRPVLPGFGKPISYQRVAFK